MALPVSTKVGSHVVSAVLAAAFATALRRQYAAWEGDLSSITPDALVAALILPAVAFAAVFGTGHFLLRDRAWPARVTYPLLGVFATLAAVVIGMPLSLFQAASNSGMLSIFFAMTAGVGSLIGFLHLRSAGRVVAEDEIAAVEAAVSERTHPFRTAGEAAEQQGETDASSGEPAAQLGKLSTEVGDFYDGPVEVPTSMNAMVTAALVGGLVHTLYAGFVMNGFSGAFSGPQGRLAEQFASGELISSIAFSLVFSAMVCLVFLTPAIYGLHRFLVSRGWTQMNTYVLAGAVAPVAAGLAMFVMGILITHWFIFPLAAAMGVYRHLAGLAPASLPEDIEVIDQRTLISADHVRRRLRRIQG